jgi:hypothetical protein
MNAVHLMASERRFLESRLGAVFECPAIQELLLLDRSGS